MTAVHQLLPTFAGRDAIGTHCLHAQRLLRDAGFESEIFAREILPDVRHLARDASRFRSDNDTWALYHFSIGDPLVTDVVASGVPLAIDYHNITPARFFRRWEPRVAELLDDGRRRLADLATPTRFALADSTYNAEELSELGFGPTAVAPVLVDLAGFAVEPDRTVLEQRRAGKAGADWLAVGRLAPNKCQHDIIAAFAVYRAAFDPGARLVLVGGRSAPQYSASLARLSRRLGVESAVTFADSVSHTELVAHYRSADVFVSLSEHEGFNVPVVEAMALGLPVVAYATTAVPETVGRSGVLLDDKDPLVVAATVDTVLRDTDARDTLVAAGRARAAELALERTGPTFLAAIEAGLDAAA